VFCRTFKYWNIVEACLPKLPEEDFLCFLDARLSEQMRKPIQVEKLKIRLQPVKREFKCNFLSIRALFLIREAREVKLSGIF
jgi:hypothetical protein